MDDKRKPVEVRKVGTVRFAGSDHYIVDEDDNWYPLPFHVAHMIGSRAEVVVRQLPDSPET